MAYIRKFKDKWRAEIQRNGERSSKVCETKREAQAWALEQESKAKRLKSSGGATFGDAVAKYIEAVSSAKRGSVWEVRRLNAALEHFGDVALIEIDTPQIAAWRDTRLKTVSGSTVVRESTLLKHLFRIARDEWRWLEHDPFRGVRMPKENEPRDQLWTWQLIKRVLTADRQGKTKEMIDAFHIALRTGMRLGEVLQAPDNFNPVQRVVTLAQTKTTGKVKIPIGRIAAKLLNRPTFVVNANEGSTLFSKLCRELLIDGLTFHDTRGTALTHLSRKVDVLTLAKISRHKDLSLLSNVYYRETADSIAAKI